MTNKTIVNSWNEWDPLKHVIVKEEALFINLVKYMVGCKVYMIMDH